MMSERHDFLLMLLIRHHINDPLGLVDGLVQDRTGLLGWAGSRDVVIVEVSADGDRNDRNNQSQFHSSLPLCRLSHLVSETCCGKVCQRVTSKRKQCFLHLVRTPDHRPVEQPAEVSINLLQGQ